jgi:hypothetical protein
MGELPEVGRDPVSDYRRSKQCADGSPHWLAGHEQCSAC